MNACDQCGQADATIQYTEVAGGEVSRIQLCRRCAATNGLLSDSDEGGVEALISRVSRPERRVGRTAGSKSRRCPTCEMTWEEFESFGSLGCEDCYKTFAMSLTRLLRESHRALLHHGTSRARRVSDPSALLPELRSLLDQAIREEDYEAAASLRDRIQNLESEVEAAGRSAGEARTGEPAPEDDEDDEPSSGEGGRSEGGGR